MVDPPYRIKNMVPGMIMLWPFSIESIPSGWHECDGTMGTPDLRDLFIRGAKAGYPPCGHGGNVGHTHPFTGDGHKHVIPEGTGLAAGTDFALETEEDPAVGTTDNAFHTPPYHRLAYIMKL